MTRETLSNIVAGFSAVMMFMAFIALFACKTNEELMFITINFIGWGGLGAIILCIRK